MTLRSEVEALRSAMMMNLGMTKPEVFARLTAMLDANPDDELAEADRETGRKWRENSALEEWFPLTGERLKAAEDRAAMWDWCAKDFNFPFDVPTGWAVVNGDGTDTVADTPEEAVRKTMKAEQN